MWLEPSTYDWQQEHMLMSQKYIMWIILAVGQNLLECLEVHNPRYIVADFISLNIASQLAFSNPVADIIPFETSYYLDFLSEV